MSTQNLYKEIKKQLQHSTKLSSALLEKIKPDNCLHTITLRNNETDCILHFLANQAAQGKPLPFVAVFDKLKSQLDPCVFTVKCIGAPDNRLTIIEQLLAYSTNNKHSERIRKQLDPFFRYFSSFDFAQQYFVKYPQHIKLKKVSPKHHSFLKSGKDIYQLPNKRINQNAFLGEGGFGKVKRMYNQQAHVLKVKIEGGDKRRYQMSALEIQEKINNITDFIYRPLKNLKLFMQSAFIGKSYTIMPDTLPNGITLRQVLHQKNPLDKTQMYIIGILIAFRVGILHSKHRLSHADLKPENIIIELLGNSTKIAKVALIDFDSSVEVPAGKNFVTLMQSFGTLSYQAPETKNGIYCFASDIYSLGIIFRDDLKLPVFNMLNKAPNKRSKLSQVIYSLTQLALQQSDLNEQDKIKLNLIEQRFAPRNTQITNSSTHAMKETPHATLNIDTIKHVLSRTYCSWLYKKADGVIYNNQDWLIIHSGIDFVTDSHRQWASLGSSPARECLLFDMDSPKIKEIKDLFLDFANIRADKSIEGILKYICYFVETLAYKSPQNVEEQLNNYINQVAAQNGTRNPIIKLDTLINNKLMVCRHKALLSTYLVSECVKNNLLPLGIVRQFRSDLIFNGQRQYAHTWTVFRNTSNSNLWLIDPTTNFVSNVTTSVNYNLQDILFVEKKIDENYGCAALCTMINRLNQTDAHDAFISNFLTLQGGLPFNLSVKHFYAPNSKYAAIKLEVVSEAIVPEEIESIDWALRMQQIYPTMNTNSIYISYDHTPNLRHFDFPKFVQDLCERHTFLKATRLRKSLLEYAKSGDTGNVTEILKNSKELITEGTLTWAAKRAAKNSHEQIFNLISKHCTGESVDNLRKHFPAPEA